jgi:hypothetical protein
MKFQHFPLSDVGLTLQVVGVIYSGSTSDQFYAVPFPGYEDEVETGLDNWAVADETVIVEAGTEGWKALLRQGDLAEVEVLSRNKAGELSKAIARKSQRQIDSQVSWNVFRRDNFSCRYCGTEKLHLTVDHLIPWEDGGPSIEGNLNSSCRPCNKVRGRTSYASWLKHPAYIERSKGLSIVVQERNVQVADTLAAIPRNPVIRER